MSERLHPMLDLTRTERDAHGNLGARRWLIRADLVTQVMDAEPGVGPGRSTVYLSTGEAVPVEERALDIFKALNRVRD